MTDIQELAYYEALCRLLRAGTPQEIFEARAYATALVAEYSGRIGGRSKSRAKARAARANGKNGGRPKVRAKTIR